MKVLSAVAWPYANGPRHLGHVAGFARALRRLQPVHADGGPRRAHGQRLRRARHADPRPRRPGGRDAARARRHATTRSSPHELADLGCSYDLYTRTTTTNHYASRRSCSPRSGSNGYMVEQTTQGAISPVDRPHPARPLHRGHLPDLRLPRGARRPVRQLRQPARADRPHRPDSPRSTARRPSSSRPSTSSSTCRRSPTPCASGSRAARRAAPGGRTSSSSASTSSTTSARGR